MNEALRNNSGIAAVEFAILALPMLVLVMGSMEMGLQIYNKGRVESVMRQAARMAITGDPNIRGEKGENIDKYVRESLKFTANTKVDIRKKFYDEFSQIDTPEKLLSNSTTAPYCFVGENNNQQWDQNPSQIGLGNGDDIVEYEVKVSYDSLFPLVTNVVTGEERLTISAKTTLQNEPFTGNVDQRPRNCCVSAALGNPVTCED